MSGSSQSPDLHPATYWPALRLDEWRDTYATLHMWTQIVGKVRLALSPPMNHWWSSTLYVAPRGLTTSTVHCGTGSFSILFDFIDHLLVIHTSNGRDKTIKLAPRSVADFYQELMAALHELGINVQITTMPQEVPNPIPFDQDDVHASYDPEYAHRFWHILVHADRVLNTFRAGFVGKTSPVHFFWGSFDLALTRFSGRPAPPRPGADSITREAYSHEAISCGFWPGSGPVQEPAFYAYAAPTPAGLEHAPVEPSTAWYSSEMGEFLLRYEDVRLAPDPDATLLAFVQSTYEAAADLAGWDRAALERR